MMILLFLLFTSPTSSHALVHAALVNGLKPWQKSEDTNKGSLTEGGGS